MSSLHWISGVLSIALFFGCVPGIEESAEHLENGLKNIDPVGFKKLLDENAKLRESVDNLRSLMNTAPTGSGVIVAEGRDLQFTIPQYSGGFKISGWVDSQKNWFWQDRVFCRHDVSLGFDFIKAFEASMSPAARSLGPNADDWDMKSSFAAKFANTASEAKFQDFLRTSAYIPRPDSATVDLNSQLGAGNLHKLTIVVTPIESDAHGKWSLRGKLLLKRREGMIESLKEFDLGSDLAPGVAVGHPLQPINILLMLKESQ